MQEAEKKCAEEIAEVLAKYDCVIDASFVVGAGGITPMVQVVSKVKES